MEVYRESLRSAGWSTIGAGRERPADWLQLARVVGTEHARTELTEISDADIRHEAHDNYTLSCFVSHGTFCRFCHSSSAHQHWQRRCERARRSRVHTCQFSCNALGLGITLADAEAMMQRRLYAVAEMGSCAGVRIPGEHDLDAAQSALRDQQPDVFAEKGECLAADPTHTLRGGSCISSQQHDSPHRAASPFKRSARHLQSSGNSGHTIL